MIHLIKVEKKGSSYMAEKMNAQDLGQALWACADEMRSIMDANEYKDYLLGLVFYKALSDNQLRTVADLIDGDEEESLEEAQASYEKVKENPKLYGQLYKELEGRYSVVIEPERTFNAFCKAIDAKSFLLTNLKEAFTAIEQAKGGFYTGLFEGFNIFSEKLGGTERKRNTLISNCMKQMSMQNFSLYNNDILGDAYEYLIAKFAEGSGKKAGEFYTPKQVSIILSRIVTHGKNNIDGFSIYDACCGSASLLLHAKDYIDQDKRKHIYYYGQEKNTSTYRLARMNCMLHQIPYQYQNFRNGDTLDEDWPSDEPTTFQAVVMNPPYSLKWPSNSSMLADPRFSRYEKLAPKGAADYAFLLHGLYHLRDDGMMGIVLPLGVLFRGGAEGTIRKHLIVDGSIYAVVGLAGGLFYSTGIPVCLVFLRKNNTNRDILFVDASKEFEKGKAQNYLTDANVDKIVETVLARKDVEKLAHLASYDEIVQNGYNLNIPRYVDTFEEEEPIDINEQNAALSELNKIAQAAAADVDAYFLELGLKVGE